MLYLGDNKGVTRFNNGCDVQLTYMTFLSGAGDAVIPPLTLSRWGMVGDRAFELCYPGEGWKCSRDEGLGAAAKSLVGKVGVWSVVSLEDQPIMTLPRTYA